MPLRETRRKDGDWYVEWLIDDDTPAASLLIVDRRMRIGSAVVKMGGIAGVGTRREHRMMGYASRIMHGANELMSREGYDMGFLFGIPDFYHRFGYAARMPEHEGRVDTRNAERASRTLKTRPMKEEDAAAIVRICNRDTAKLTASVERPRGWKPFPRGTFFGRDADARVVLDKRNRVVGYVAYDRDTNSCRVSEVGGSGSDVYHAILAFLGDRAVKLRREEISFSIAFDHPFARWARDFGFRHTADYQRNRGAMARIINLETTFEKIAPELSSRYPSDAPRASFAIASDIGSVTLSCAPGNVSVSSRKASRKARIDQLDLTQLLMGYKSARDLADTGKLKAPRPVLDALSLLFPLQVSHMWWADRF